MPIRVTLKKEELHLSDEIIGFIRKEITPHGNGAHVLCPKEYLGKIAYLVVCRE